MSDLGDLYQEVILDHTRRPHNYRTIENPSTQAKGHNPLCGDQVTVFVRLNGDRIEDVSFQGQGCAISKSSASIMTDLVKGKSTSEASTLFERFHRMVTGAQKTPPAEDDKMAVFSGVAEFPARVKCASLAWHTLKSALEGKAQPVKTE